MQSETIKRLFDGKEYTATYSVESGWVHVFSIWGTRDAKAGASPAAIASLLFTEILQDARRRYALD